MTGGVEIVTLSILLVQIVIVDSPYNDVPQVLHVGAITVCEWDEQNVTDRKYDIDTWQIEQVHSSPLLILKTCL